MGYFLYEDMAIVKQKRAESPITSIAQGDALGYGGYWAFSPHRMSFDTPSSCICKDNPELLLI